MHIRELSSVRGIAAVVVLFGHVFSIVGRTSSAATDGFVNAAFVFLGRTFNGNAAVELFFVLSGLVLSLSLKKRGGDRLQWIGAFYVRRVFRIFPALWVSLGLALLLLQFERSSCLPQLCNHWAIGAFQDDYVLKRIFLSFLGIYVHLNGPMWSLRAELFYSALFPAMFLLLWNRKTRWGTFLVILVLALSPIPRLYSVHYGLAFALGAIIPSIEIKRKRLPYGPIVLAALVALIFSRQIFSSFGFEEKTFEIIEMVASFFILYPIFHKKVKVTFLRNDMLFYVGEISYSIYVLHFPLLFALLYALEQVVGVSAIRDNPNFSTIILAVITLGATLLLSALNFRFIEAPFQKLGHATSRRIRRA